MELDAPLSPEGVRIGRFLFLGPSGSGKTTIAGAFIREVLRWPPDNIRSVAPPTKPTLSRLIRARHIAVSVSDRDAQEAAFRRIWTEATEPYETGGHDIGFVLDDADFYFSAMGRAYGTDSLAEIVKLGREAGLSQVFVAQGSAAVSKDLISNSTLVAIAATDEPNLLDYFRRYGQDIPDAEYTVAHLPEHVFLIYCPNARPKLQGLWKVVDGHIEVKEWEGQPTDTESPTDPDPSGPSENEPPPSTSDDTASGPDAESASPIVTAPATATSTSPKDARS